MYTRHIQSTVISKLFLGKAIVIYGARQVGKTTLCKTILSQYQNTYYLSGDDPYTAQLLTNKSVADYKTLFGGYTIVCIDEAQMIPNIGSILKLLVDHLSDVQIIATGSSSFDLANKINEPLTGRAFVYHLFPISIYEMCHKIGTLAFDEQVKQRIIFGMYPENIVHNNEKMLTLLTENYVYKDVFARDFIKRSDLIIHILKALAFQIGNQVSYNEIANLVGSDVKTIQKYIYLLEQAFIIFRLPSFSKNLRNEIKTTQKIFFRDTGIRNSLIRNYALMDMRNDAGVLRENFVIAEFMKQSMNNDKVVNHYFWRTRQQHEIDYIQEYNGNMKAFEVKRNNTKKISRPKSFVEAYPQVLRVVINPNTYLQYLL